MKTDKINFVSILLILLLIIKAIYDSMRALKMNDTHLLTNILVAPILAIMIYLLFTYLIKHPHLLVTTSLSDFENSNQIKERKNVIYWKDYYYIFRLIILLVIGILYFFT